MTSSDGSATTARPLLVISIALVSRSVMINELRRQSSGLEELAETAEQEGELDAADDESTE